MMAVDFVVRVVSALEKLAIPYMAVGSFSSNIYGQPRSTKDADFVVELRARPISDLVTEIHNEFDFDPQMSFETITATTRYRFKHRATAFMVEIFLLSDDPHDQARFARRVTGDIGGRITYVPTAEDVIITKLRWSKQGRRQKDIDDVRNIVALRWRALDLPYIRSWCNQHGTRDLFEKLLLESQQFEQEHP
jgi:hypothetical protein